jgi:DNA-binding transcriptional MerR regulator
MGPYIPIGQVAEMYGVTERTVRNWISQGLINAYKRNNHAVFIDERSLDNILTPIQGVRR